MSRHPSGALIEQRFVRPLKWRTYVDRGDHHWIIETLTSKGGQRKAADLITWEPHG